MIKNKTLSKGLSEGRKIEMPIADVLFVLILECSQTNLVLNGWWTLPQNTTEKYKRTKQRTPNSTY
jgi:hypothetical protein